MTDAPTKDRLILTAARLFRLRGYHGVGLAEILSEARAPKGSLYHHFPDGKADLALAAAEWLSDGMIRIIDDAFEGAQDYRDGATTLCFKLAKFFDVTGGWEGCPVSSILVDGPENESFRNAVNDTHERWVGHVAGHAIRLGVDKADAPELAEILMIIIEGAWIMARSRNSSDVLRKVPARLPT